MGSTQGGTDYVLQRSHDRSVVEMLDAREGRPLIVVSLQWSHDRSVVEIARAGELPGDPAVASMEPRPFGRGNAGDQLILEVQYRTLQWGHDRSVVEMVFARTAWYQVAGLQWGHDRSVVEKNTLYRYNVEINTLQWGHDLLVVEIPACRTWKRCFTGFNGATTARSWKFARERLATHRASGLQWGHDRSVVEITVPSGRRTG